MFWGYLKTDNNQVRSQISKTKNLGKYFIFFKDYCNLIYALDSATAFKEGLVKSITVQSLGLQNRVESYLQYKSRTGTSLLEIIRLALSKFGITDGDKKQSKEITCGKKIFYF